MSATDTRASLEQEIETRFEEAVANGAVLSDERSEFLVENAHSTYPVNGLEMPTHDLIVELPLYLAAAKKQRKER